MWRRNVRVAPDSAGIIHIKSQHQELGHPATPLKLTTLYTPNQRVAALAVDVRERRAACGPSGCRTSRRFTAGRSEGGVCSILASVAGKGCKTQLIEGELIRTPQFSQKENGFASSLYTPLPLLSSICDVMETGSVCSI